MSARSRGGADREGDQCGLAAAQPTTPGAGGWRPAGSEARTAPPGAARAAGGDAADANGPDGAPWGASEQALGWPKLLDHLAGCCSTPRGTARARQLAPLADAAAVSEMIALVSEARALATTGQALAFEAIVELAPALRRLAKEGALGGRALYEVALTLQSLAALRASVTRQRARAPGLAARAARLHGLETVWRPILACCLPGGELTDQASPELGLLRQQVRALQQRITQQLKRLMETPPFAQQLQDRFVTQRDERYVLPLRADAGPLREGIVLGASASGATLFVEPTAVVGLNNELQVLQLAVARETSRLLLELSARVGAEHEAIAVDLELATELDLIAARARLAERLEAHPVAVAADGALELQGLRHPLLLLAGGEVVGHDLTLSPQQALVISGPNAGGKSVGLKSVGLCALMLRCGMHLPVRGPSRLPYYSQVWADIGDEQSLERQLSTFTAHLQRLLGFLEQADRQTLILLDEIAGGTDPGEGAALGQALLEALVDRVAQLVVTTHYEALKSLALGDPRFVNASVGFELQRLAPTFELHQGVPGSSFALVVAQRLGLPPTLNARARTLLGERAERSSELMVRLADERSRLRQTQQRLELAEQRAQAERQGYEHLRRELQQREQRALAQTHREALAELTRARQELQRLRRALRQPVDREALRVLDQQVSVVARTVAVHGPRPTPALGPPLPAEALVIGARVRVGGLGAEAEIVAAPQRGRVTVLLGGLRTQVGVEQLHAPAPGPTPAPATDPGPRGRALGAGVDPPGTATLDAPGRGPDNTLDLRGQRVEDALRAAERFLDQSLLEGRDLIYLLHGHGSGALRRALRTELERSPAVERWSAAEPRAGGEALTVVWLR